MPIYRGTAPVTAIYRGATPINEIRRGSTLVWSRSAIRDCFEVDGWLQGWINELCSDPGNLISNGFGLLVDGLDNTVGQIVQFVQGGVNQTGTLIATGADAAINAYCGLWGGTAPDGLLGLINGIPLIGPSLANILKDWFGGTLDITSLVGSIPVVGQLAQQIGLLPDELGQLADPINYVIDELGNVLGIITCGQYKDLGGVFEPICFAIGKIGGAARLIVPDGLMSLDLTTSRFRYPTLTAGDDGYLEIEVAEGGGPGVITQAFRRYSNNGTGANGVGIDLRNSAASIVRRVASVDTLVAPNLGSFASGDRLRLVQAGNTHTLFKNGDPLGLPWVDTGTAAIGAGFRSVAMLMQGAQPLNGTRIFSPALSCIEAA